MVGTSFGIVGAGVIVGGISGGPGGDGLTDDNFGMETFVYDGENNEFELADFAFKVLDVIIDHGSYPLQIPAGGANSVIVDEELLFEGVQVTIKYIK